MYDAHLITMSRCAGSTQPHAERTAGQIKPVGAGLLPAGMAMATTNPSGNCPGLLAAAFEEDIGSPERLFCAVQAELEVRWGSWECPGSDMARPRNNSPKTLQMEASRF
jgi:hypothetical protein